MNIVKRSAKNLKIKSRGRKSSLVHQWVLNGRFLEVLSGGASLSSKHECISLIIGKELPELLMKYTLPFRSTR